MAGGKYLYISKTGRSRRTRNTAKKVPTTLKTYVKRTINANIETKQHVSNQVATTIDYDVSPFVEDMTQLQRNDANNNRDGNVVKAKSLVVRYHVDGKDGDYCRILVLQWKQDTATVSPTINIAVSNNVFNNTFGSGTEYLSPIDEDYRQYFNVLADRLICLDAGAGEHNSGIITIAGSKMNNLYFNDASVTGKNHIFICATSNATNALSPPEFTYTSDFLFKDI